MLATSRRARSFQNGEPRPAIRAVCPINKFRNEAPSTAREAFPRVVFACVNRRTRDVVTALQDFSLDYGLIRENAVPAGLCSQSVGILEYRLYVPKALLPVKTPKNTAQLLAQFPLATLDGDGDYTEGLLAIAHKADRELHIALTCSTLPQVCRAVSAAGFAAVLPILARQELPEQKIAELDVSGLQSLRRSLALCWNSRLVTIRDGAERVSREVSRRLQDRLQATAQIAQQQKPSANQARTAAS